MGIGLARFGTVFLALGAITVVALLLVVPFALYVVARWRASREPLPDPQLGAKFVLHYFATIGIQLALAGGMMLLFTIISPGPSEYKGGEYRAAFALLLPAGMIIGIHFALLNKTNDEQYPNVRRLFTGYNLFCVGLIGFIALLLGFQVLFMKGSMKPMSHFVGSMVAVYCTAWGVLGYRFAQLIDPVAPSRPAAMPEPVTPLAATSSTSLPALRDGAFPPMGPPSEKS